MTKFLNSLIRFQFPIWALLWSLLCSCSDTLQEIKENQPTAEKFTVSLQEAIDFAIPYLDEAETQATRTSIKRIVMTVTNQYYFHCNWGWYGVDNGYYCYLYNRDPESDPSIPRDEYDYGFNVDGNSYQNIKVFINYNPDIIK